MSTTLPLVELDEVKVKLPIRAGNPDFDQELTDLILTATLQIEKHTNRLFTSQVHTEFFNTRQSRVRSLDVGGTLESGVSVTAHDQPINLRGFPLDISDNLTLVILNYDPNRDFLASTLLSGINNKDYFVDGDEQDHRSGIILTKATQRFLRSLKITYTAGYASAGSPATLSAAAPNDLKAACVYQAMHMFQRTRPENIGVGEDRTKGGKNRPRFMRTGGITPEVGSLLVPYRRLLTGRG